MKWIILFPLMLVLSACSLFLDNIPQNDEPEYNLPLVWESDIERVFSSKTVSDDTGIYVYNFKKDNFADVRLMKIDPETGKAIWITDYFGNNIQWCQPIIMDNYIFVFIKDNIILCFDKTSGTKLAQVKLIYDNPNMWVNSGYCQYNNFFYFGIGDTNISDYYLARINIDSINKNGNPQDQEFKPELLWQSHNNRRIYARPLVYNDVVYCHTVTLSPSIPIEFGGININTKEELFYTTMGGDKDYYYDSGGSPNSLFVKDDVLYYLGGNLWAYDLQSNKWLYRIEFNSLDINFNPYSAAGRTDPVFYKNRIYYTNTASNAMGEKDVRNIFCVDARSGKLVWSAIAKNSESLGTNPVIYNNKVFVTESTGIRVYNADSGALIGVEKNIEGDSTSNNQLFGNKMITIRLSAQYPDGQLIALDLSK